MSKNTLPRLIINALCTTCGEITPEDESIPTVQEALAHVARSSHVVILNGTVDVAAQQGLAPLTPDLEDADATLEDSTCWILNR
jgi:hypothetical protein